MLSRFRNNDVRVLHVDTYGFALLGLQLKRELLDRVVLVEVLHFVAEQVYTVLNNMR